MKKLIVGYSIGLVIVLILSPILSATHITQTITISSKNNNINELDSKIIKAIELVNESILREFLEQLVSIGPRMTGTYGCEKAAEYIYDQFQDFGLEARYHEWESWKPYIIGTRYLKSRNVVGTLSGKGELSDEVLIINAHFDSIFDVAGAIDDGAGTVAVMATAYALSQYEFNRTIKFIAFSGEEVGLLGSRAYINEFYEGDQDILLQINLDGIGYATTEEHANNLQISSTVDAEWMYEEIKNVNKDYNIDFNIDYRGTLEPGGPRSYTSDFYDFLLHGYEAVDFKGTEPYEYWHTEEDTYDKINIEYLTKITKLLAASLAYMADIDVYYPRIHINSPRRGRVYYEDVPILKSKYEKTIVVDDVLLSAYVKPGDAPIEKVEFYVDGDLVHTDTEKPYQWRLNEFSISKHTVQLIVHDEKGRTAEDQITFRYINLLRRK